MATLFVERSTEMSSGGQSKKAKDELFRQNIRLFGIPARSPDLNPIELAFNVYKSHLKRNSSLFEWLLYQAHGEAIESVTKDMCIKEFRRCGVPGSNAVKTSTELEEEDDTNTVNSGTTTISNNTSTT